MKQAEEKSIQQAFAARQRKIKNFYRDQRVDAWYYENAEQEKKEKSEERIRRNKILQETENAKRTKKI